MKPLKQHIKRGIQHVAARFGAHTRKESTPRLLILMYHRVLPAHDYRLQTEEPGMFVTPETFRSHIKYISQTFDLISLNEWISRKTQGQTLPANACAVTFDDGWADNYEYAFPVLKQHQAPATIFLVSDMIGTSQTFWPERLARLMRTLADSPEVGHNEEHQWLHSLLSGTGLTDKSGPETTARVIANAKILSDSRLSDLLDASEAALNIVDRDQPPSLLNWTQVNEMIDSGLIEVGSHTRHHVRLDSNCDAVTLEDEVITSKKIIEERVGRQISTFCYPNGDYSPAALDFVRQHYAGAVTTNNGWNSCRNESHTLNRIGVHEDSSSDRTAFLARISGWM